MEEMSGQGLRTSTRKTHPHELEISDDATMAKMFWSETNYFLYPDHK